MNGINDGGPAFPANVHFASNGMTLRDYFAAKAMPMLADALYSNRREILEGGTVADTVAKIAYDYADAMLKARTA